MSTEGPISAPPTLLDQSALAPWIDQTVGTFPTPAPEASVPFMNQIATLPLVSCQRMSLLPSPSKSPVSTIDQMAGAEPAAAACVTCSPFINQIATVPLLVSRHRMSLLPSPLKSPVPAMVQLVGTEPTPAPEACAPFMNQIATLPLLSCQRMSLLPSPSKSPVPTIVQLVGAFPTPAAWVTCAPFN